MRLVAGARGTAYVLFGSNGLNASRFRPSLGWSNPAALGALTGRGADIAMDAIGNAFVVWSGAGISYSRYVAGTGWYRAASVPTVTSPGEPGFSLLPDGRAMVAWGVPYSNGNQPATIRLWTALLQ